MVHSCLIGYVFYVWLILNGFISDISCLRNMHMTIPEAVKLGDTITLICDYDLESVALYTIKWYRNEEEFYRYVPKESPPSRVFIMPHLNVDISKFQFETPLITYDSQDSCSIPPDVIKAVNHLAVSRKISRSNSRKVTLRDVERETAGIFKCEVSADAPLFHTDMRSARLLVADIPDEEPVLRTDVHKITPGARISANCTTPGSFPSMNVTWYINDQEVQSDADIRVHNSIVFYDALPGLETVRSSIIINSSQDLFKNGRMKLSCLATMFSLYNETKELEILEDTPQLAPIREHSTHSEDGYSGGCFPNRNHFFRQLLLFILLCHLWLRK